MAAVCFLKFDPLGKILQVAANHVVAADDLVPAARVCVGEMASEEAGHAGDENFHCVSRLRYAGAPLESF